MNRKDLFIRKTLVRINVALLAISFSFFLALLQVSELDQDLTNALICNTFLFPSSFMFGLVIQTQDGLPINKILFWMLKIFTLINIAVAGWGLMELIDHFSTIASEFFTTSFVLVMLIYIIGTDLVFEKKKRAEKKPEIVEEEKK